MRFSQLLVAAIVFVLALLAGSAPVAHAATITVTNLNDSGAGSLRQAIADAAAGDTIDFGVTGTITLTAGLVINKNLNIQGPGAANLAIDGNNTVTVIDVRFVTVEMSGLTIQNGGGGAAPATASSTLAR